MKKMFVIFAIIVAMTSCNGNKTEYHNSSFTTDSISESITSFLESKTIDDLSFLSSYPDIHMISVYNDLTADQKEVLFLIGDMLSDIVEFGPDFDQTYYLSKQIAFKDFQFAHNIIAANFTPLEDYIINIFAFDSDKGKEIQSEAVDTLYLWNGEKEYLIEEYDRFQSMASEANEILCALLPVDAACEKAKIIADWMIENISYEDNEEANTAYGALINKKAVCDGYAKAYDFLCKKAGLETIYVLSNESTMNHAWNMIRIEDKWYHIDVTWMEGDLGRSMKNFMMPDSVCYETHPSAVYYTNPITKENVIPKANCSKLFPYYYPSAASAVYYYKAVTSVQDYKKYVLFDNENILDEFMLNNGTIVNINNENYTMTIGTWVPYGCTVSFCR